MVPRITDNAEDSIEKPLLVSVVGAPDNTSDNREELEDEPDREAPLLSRSWSDDEAHSSSSSVAEDRVDLQRKGEILTPPPLSTDRNGTLPSAIFNLASTILGGGVLSLPYAYHLTGIIGGTLLLFSCAAITSFSITLLVASSRRYGDRNYEEVATRAMGKTGKYSSIILLIIMIYMSCIAYAILMGDMMVPMLNFIAGDKDFVSDWGVKVVMMVCSTIALPLCCAHKLTGLKTTSAISFVSILALVVVVAIRSPTCIHTGCGTAHYKKMDVLYWPQKVMDVPNALPVFIVAFVCHFNVLPVHAEIRRPSRRRMKKISDLTMSLCCIPYLAVGAVGYYTFREKTEKQILGNYKPDDLVISIGRIGLAITLLLSYPLLIIPLRYTIMSLLDIIRGNDGAEVNRSHEESNLLLRIGLTIGLVYSSTCIGAMVNDVIVIWNILGSTVTVLVAFILPAIFYLRIWMYDDVQHQQSLITLIINRGHPKNPKLTFKDIGAISLLIFGLCMLVICTFTTFYEMFS